MALKDTEQIKKVRDELIVLTTMFDRVLNDEISQNTMAVELGITPQNLSRSIRDNFNHKIRKSLHTLNKDEFKKLYLETEPLSDKIIKSIFEFNLTDIVAIPEYDEDRFWELYKSTLNERELKVLNVRFSEDGVKTLEETAKHFGVTRERIRQIEWRAFRKLRNPLFLKKLFYFDKVEELKQLYTIKENLSKELETLENEIQQINKLNGIKKEWNNVKSYMKSTYPSLYEFSFGKLNEINYLNQFKNINIEQLGLSNRTVNALHRASINNVADILDLTVIRVLNIRNLGKKCVIEMIDKIDSLDIDYSDTAWAFTSKNVLDRYYY